MAKITPGAMVGRISGSIGGDTFSKNRYGPYVRRRAVPTVSTTEYALAAKTRLATASTAWKGLTEAQQNAWATWASTNPVIDTLGQAQILSGQVASIQINNRRLHDGQAILTLPPVTAAPAPLLSLVLATDIGLGAFGITFTTAPLPANICMWIRAAVTNSPTISWVQNLYKLVTKSAPAFASPYDCQADIEVRFGSLIVGQRVTVACATYDRTSGLLSTPLSDSGIVVST
jgi:hypothetical protein